MKVFKLFFISCFLFVTASVSTNAIPVATTIQASVLPKVFLIGEHEKEYNKLLVDYETLLLTACGNDMDMAYSKWMQMLYDMEAYSDKINFDLKGTKLWFNVFWEADGSIKHIAYYLKPISRNVDTADMNAFLNSFMKKYRFPLESEVKYSHYGSVAFPLFPKRLSDSSNE